ncbi:hypothetical protein [Pontibacter virosus]|uniref:Uncharacterized protein n=1 Tax=Pontibacter virosus TaxID=1765052 RepID=A0A2U1AWB0_9BACT|nr:hypothetical protein [Pontibacter virosus]PVY40527.1 hypothetical protein C8E01_107158 [Pontibacter virosus]
MDRKLWLTVSLNCVLTVLLTNLPFLPGPHLLYLPAQLFFSSGMFLGILGFLLIPIGLVWTIWAFIKHPEPRLSKAFAILCWALPATALVSTTWLANHTRDISRNLAMSNAAELIERVEKHYQEQGAYPETLEQLAMDQPSPWVIGIPAYFYSKTDNAYTLSFTQNVILGFNYEVVVFDPSGLHKAEGELTTLYDTGLANWKYYIYD